MSAGQARQAGSTVGEIKVDNSTVNTLIGNINTENLHIYNARNAEEDPPDSTERTARLSALQVASHARLVDRWMAVGLNESLAEQLANDESVGSVNRLGSVLPAAKMFALVGEFGSGKSVTVERLYQSWIAEAVEDENEPIPIFLEARFIEGNIGSEIRRAVTDIGDPVKVGVRLILDGLDEPGPLRALDLLSQARRAIRQWPNSQAVITVRAGLELGDLPLVEYPSMNSQEVDSLLRRVGANPNLQYSESASIRDAMRFPLFSLIAAVLGNRGAGMMYSRGSLIEAMATKALAKNGGRDIVPLRGSMLRLARLSISRNGRVPIGEIGDLGLIEAMCATRLVVRKGMTISFSLPIIEQYFAGQAILESGLPEDIATSPAKLSYWQDALVFSVEMGSWFASSSLIESIAGHYPGIAAAIVKKAILERDYHEEISLPSSLECGKMLHRSLTIWTSNLAPIGQHLGFTQQDGSLTSLAVTTEGSRLSWGIVVPWASSTLPDIIPVTPEVRDLCKQIGSGVVSSPYMAWPLRWSLARVTDGIEQILKHQALRIPNNIKAQQERDWALAKAILDQPTANHHPISVDALSQVLGRFLSELSDEIKGVRFSNRRAVAVSEILDFQRRISNGEILTRDDLLVRPYPTPDISPFGRRWIWDGYSTEVLRVLVEEVYTNALHIYEDMVVANFPKLLPTLGIGGALPLLLEGVLTVVQDTDEYNSPSLHSKTVLLNQGETSRARIRVGPEMSEGEWGVARMRAEQASIKAHVKNLRPVSGGWLSLEESWSAIDDVFGDTPAIDQAYRWLWGDLRRVGLTKSNTPLWMH